jgi:hypothetical protein
MLVLLWQYAVADYYPQERLMERVTICGDRPFYDAGAQPLNLGLNFDADAGRNCKPSQVAPRAT